MNLDAGVEKKELPTNHDREKGGLSVLLNRIPFLGVRFDSHMHEVVRGASVAFVLKIMGAVMAFTFNVLLARLFGAEGVGMYFLAMTIVTAATVFGRMGLDNSLVRFVSSCSASGDWVAVKGVYNKGMLIAFAASAVITAAVFFLAPYIAENVFIEKGLTGTLRLMSLAIIPITLMTLHSECLRGLRRIGASLFLQSVGVQGLTLAGLILLGRLWGLNGVVLGYVLAASAMALTGLWLWRYSTRSNCPTLGKGAFSTTRLFASSLPLMLVSSMYLLNRLTSTFVIGIFRPVEEVGLYNAALKTAMLSSLILFAVNSIAAPKFAALYQQNDIRALSNLAIRSTRLAVLFSGIILSFFIIAPAWVMGLFGENFRSGSTVLVILSVAQFINVGTGSVGQMILVMTGHEKVMGNLVSFSALLNVVSNIIFIRYWGITGAALSTALSWSVLNIMATYYLRKRLGLRAHLLAPLSSA